jgi:hypothetical protein
MPRVASSYLQGFARQNCFAIGKPVVLQKKKQIQKKLREEKILRARIEEKQRIDAMRERRVHKIDKLSEAMTGQLIRFFMIAETDRIVAVETKMVRQTIQVVEEASSEPIMVAANGLMYGRRYVTQ